MRRQPEQQPAGRKGRPTSSTLSSPGGARTRRLQPALSGCHGRHVVGAGLSLGGRMVISQAASEKCHLRKACCSCPLCHTEHESSVSARHWRIRSLGSVGAVWWRLLPRDGHLLLTAVGSEQSASGSFHLSCTLPQSLWVSGSREVLRKLEGTCMVVSVTGKHHRHLLSSGTDADILQCMRHMS